MDNKKQMLRRNKMIATGLMVGAAILFVIARTQKGSGAWEWVAAFAEAAMVGALADWFAVVALFRHPLGIPIPHTAIIKNKKDAIAGNLANFIRDKFLAPETLAGKLKEYDPAERLASYLISGNNADVLARGAVRICSESLDFMDDDRVQRLLQAALSNRIENFDLASSAAVLIDTLRNNNRHQVVLDDVMARCAAWLSSPEAQAKLAVAIDNLVKKEYPLLSQFIPNRDQFSKGAGEKIVNRINEFVQDVSADPAHKFRQTFDITVTDFVVRLKSDQVLRTQIETVKLEAVHNTFLSDYVKNLANDLKVWLCNDLERPDSKIHGKIAEAITGFGSTLAKNRELKDSLNEHLETLVIRYGDTMRTAVAKHISETVQQWETDEYVNEIELSIGSDLQFIRMNGTLVGGLIGLLLHAIALLL
ncbi:DUF445 domain-containing protein [Pelotalea chapellei]|uniref:DUF445 family protein n=1 Tax=Pelotalea chapellei TaxID=44671 RepID=A0ABS5U9Q3_9BACT|nr:DUF445 domain-containing protein [Pelotalea chapellei]MBT1072388.1 DUF445 family protein [Pelotalea chapellei]